MKTLYAQDSEQEVSTAPKVNSDEDAEFREAAGDAPASPSPPPGACASSCNADCINDLTYSQCLQLGRSAVMAAKPINDTLLSCAVSRQCGGSGRPVALTVTRSAAGT